MDYTETNWLGCYRETWKGLVVPESLKHPARFSRSMIARIFDHTFEQAWVKTNSSVLDPFAGVALGAADALRLGLNWTGYDVEERYVELGNQNIERWPGQGSAKIVHGDAKRLTDWIRKESIDFLVSSPPFGTIRLNDGARSSSAKKWKTDKIFGRTEGQLGYRDKNTRASNSAKRITCAETFWSDAAIAIKEIYQVLKSGAYAIWVCKGHVLAGKYIDFPMQWKELCESVGFKTIHWHNASLVEGLGSQYTFEGGERELRVQRKSMFKRVSESKGSPKIDVECCLCMIKQEGALITSAC